MKIGDRVKVVGQSSFLFTGHVGTIIGFRSGILDEYVTISVIGKTIEVELPDVRPLGLIERIADLEHESG